jgi:hypothetical protein
VAVATGKLDALVYLLGVLVGIFAFGEVYPLIRDLFYASSLGELTLPQVFHLPYGLVVLLVVLMAVGGFLGAEYVERKLAQKAEAG